ncbi:MAG TPA: hypothetical protein VFG69_08110, partial [Nannocystaceae bacterium]|nr:hypothetical protein [Nannocystaceae bacterium]
APARVAVRLSPSGGTLRIEGRSSQGLWSRTVTVPALEHGTGSAAVVALFGREKVEDLEMIRAADEASPTIEHEITALGLDFQISTRLTSWVAIDRERSVDPRTPTRRDRVPQALPHGTSVAGLGLRPAVQPMPMQYAVTSPAAPMAAAGGAFETSKGAAIAEGAVRAVHRVLGRRASPPPPASPAPEMDEQLDAEMASTTGVHTRFFELRAEIVGRFTTLADGTLVVEIDAPAAGLEWHVPLDVELELADGRRVRAIVDATRTTLAGIHNAGTRIRLVCPGAGSFGPPLGVHIGGAAALVIRPGAP